MVEQFGDALAIVAACCGMVFLVCFTIMMILGVGAAIYLAVTPEHKELVRDVEAP